MRDDDEPTTEELVAEANEDTDEEPATEPEPEPDEEAVEDEEPAAPAEEPESFAIMEERGKQFDQLRKHVATRVGKILGDDAAMVAECPFCSYYNMPGWVPVIDHPADLQAQEMTVRPDGRPAWTGYETLAARAGIALLALDLKTGRTHQIRVHLKSLGHPLIGDPVYGEARWKALPRSHQATLRDFPRPALHAWRLAFRHPTTGEPVAFEAPVPVDVIELWERVTGAGWPVGDLAGLQHSLS